MNNAQTCSPSTPSFAGTSDRALFLAFVLLFFLLPIATSPAVIAGVLALAIWILSGKVVSDRRRWLHEPWTLPLAFFILLPWIGLLWAPDVLEGMRFASKTYYYCLAFALATVRLSDQDIEVLLKAFLAGLLVAAFASLLQVIGVLPLAKSIPSLIFAKRIHGSMFLVLGLALLATYLKDCRDTRMRVLLGLLMLFFVFILGMSGGRSGYVSLFLVSPLVLYKLTGRFHLKKIAVAAVLMIAVLLSFGPVRERFGEIGQEFQEYRTGNPNSSIGIRMHMWNGAAQIMTENPLLGVGTGGYRAAMKRFETSVQVLGYQDVDNPHSNFFYMGASFGLIGVASLIWLLWAMLRKGWLARHSRAGFAVLIYGVMAILVGITSTTIMDFATANLMSLMIGIRSSASS
ncbi:MAG: O-antigen ligase family protein [Nitrospiraceae bacterium]|jgi:O-antigen ligase|nr:O-antigen ligase family protein [Nitrospiraceae bacterium]